MNNVLDIARYIIKFFNDNNIPITHLKLQKLLYFVQMNFLFQLDQPCFNEKIIALPLGPVVDEILTIYSQFGRDELKEYSDINIENYKLVDEVCIQYLNTSASRLVDITHNQSPWQNAQRKGFGTEITVNDIKDFINYITKNRF